MPLAGPATVGNNNPTSAGLGHFNVLGRRWFFQDIGGTSIYGQRLAMDIPLRNYLKTFNRLYHSNAHAN